MGHFDHRDNDAGGQVWQDNDYRILRCRGCEAVYFQHETTFSEDWNYQIDPFTGEHEQYTESTITHWPPPSKRLRPLWSDDVELDRDLRGLLSEVYVALDNDLKVLAAIGMRTTFDRASEILGVHPELSFKDKLKGLNDAGHIGDGEMTAISVLTDAGSAAAHRGWSPTNTELDTMMEILEGFINRNLVLGNATLKLKGRLPARLPNPQKRVTDH
jgi:hypothetical protein